MSELAVEIATRIRKLAEAEGLYRSLNSHVTGAYTGRELVVGGYYIRINQDGGLFVNDRRSSLHKTIFVQNGPELKGDERYPDACKQLVLVLRAHMILEDLADV